MTSDIDRLRTLMDFARQGGADPEWLATTPDTLVAALLELYQLRRGAGDPRPRRKLAKAARVARANDAMLRVGHDQQQAVLACAERFNLRPKTVRGYLALMRSMTSVDVRAVNSSAVTSKQD